MKVVPQAANCREVEVGGRIYRRTKTGLFDMPTSVAQHVIKNQGGQLPSLSGVTKSTLGYTCPDCGFGSYFKTCSRCTARNAS